MIKETETANKKSFKKYLFTLALLSVLLISAAYLKNYWIFSPKSINIVDNEQQEQTNAVNSSVEDRANSNIINGKTEQNNDQYSKEKFDNSASETIVDQSLQTLTSAANSQIANQESKFVSNDEGAFESTQYLAYLRNVNHLIVNFFLDKPYTNYLNQLKMQNLPETFLAFIDDLTEYNERYLISPPIYRQQVFPNNSQILQKFIRIDKNLAEISMKEEKKNEIINKLKFWIDYCYAEDFKMKFNQKKN